MITESLLSKIKRGRDGKNHGFEIGMPKLESIIDGVTQSTYTLIYSGTGSGKTSFALYAYIYYPLKHHLEDGNYRASIFSLEMEADILYAKILSLYLYDTYKIDLSIKEILSRKKDYILPDDIYDKVLEGIKWLKKVEQVVTIYDNTCNADYIYKCIMEELKSRGTFEKIENRRTVYTPNNPDLIHIVMIDHMSLLRPSNGRSTKGEIDLASSYLVTLRNIGKISPLVVMQINREASSMDRRKANLNNLTLTDIKDSGNP